MRTRPKRATSSVENINRQSRIWALRIFRSSCNIFAMSQETVEGGAGCGNATV